MIKRALSRRAVQWALLFLLVLAGPLGMGAARAQAAPNEPGPGASEKSTPINAVPEKREQEKDEDDAFLHSAAVAKIGSMLGMSTEQAATAFTAVNFIILAVGVGFLAVKILPKTFRERSSAIQKHLVDARTATEEASARLKAVEARLGRLDEEIAGMRKQSEADALRDDQRMKEAMEQERAKILAAADAEIQTATLTARRELQRHAAELAIEQAARRLVVSAETDRLLVQGFAERLASDKGGQN